METLNKIYGKREVMLVAHFIAKRFKLTMSDALKDSWRWFKSNSSNFTFYLSSIIKNRRKQVLSGFNLKRAILSQPTGTASTLLSKIKCSTSNMICYTDKMIQL